MFLRSYNSFDSGPKSPLIGAWLESWESNVSQVGAIKSLKLQNLKSSFVILEVLPKIPNVIDVDFNEILPEILDSIAINLNEIVELSNSQFDPQAEPLGKKKQVGVDGIRKKLCKKSYDNSRKF